MRAIIVGVKMMKYKFIFFLMLLPAPVLAANNGMVTSTGALSSPGTMLLILACLALLPFAIFMMTSFVKISVVLSIIRTALGTQQIPPMVVITGLSLILTTYVMWPVAVEMRDDFKAASLIESRDFSLDRIEDVIRAVDSAKEPLRAFLLANSSEREMKLLENAARERWKNDSVSKEQFIVLVPAFVLTQLKEGFRIGFCIYVPFLVVDLIVTNILLALGMSMLPPSLVSVPLKLLVFTASDGWALICRGLISSFKG